MKKRQDEPTVAPGIDDDEELNAEPTEEAREEGETTVVTRLVLDENDPSGEEE